MGKLIHQKVLFTFERVFRDPSGFALLSHLSRLPARSALLPGAKAPLQGRQEVCLLIVSKKWALGSPFGRAVTK